MKWDLLPDVIIKIILYYRKLLMGSKKAINVICQACKNFKLLKKLKEEQLLIYLEKKYNWNLNNNNFFELKRLKLKD